MQQLTPADSFSRTAARFSEVVEGVTDWDAPTPVDEWTARDVVAHLTSWFPAFLEAGTGWEITSGPSENEDPAGAWFHLRDQVAELLADPDRAAMTYRSSMVPEGPLGDIVDRFFTADVFMHTWDLARASGQDDTLDPEVVADMHAGMRRMEEVIRASGQFGQEQPLPAGASEQDRFIAFIGRDPSWQPTA